MEQLATGILRRSCDAIVIISQADGRVLDVNEAFLTVTGHARHELLGRPGRDLFIGLGPTADPTDVGVLKELGSLADAQIGLWTRSGSCMSATCRRSSSGSRINVPRCARFVG